MKLITVYLIAFWTFLGFSQETLNDVLAMYNKNKVPYIAVQELALSQNKTVILDAREYSEYTISHIKDAILVGYNHFNLNQSLECIPDKNQAIVVYCSLGVRSEDIAHQIKKAGYTNVKNLYGGIFEWKNNDFDVYNSKNKKTDSIHAYSKTWSKWLSKGIKVY